MSAWCISFVAIGVASVPISAQILHISNLRSLTPLQLSDIQLIDQALSTVAGVALVRFITREAGKGTTPGFLRVSLREPFRRPCGWASWALAGLAVAPIAIVLVSLLISLLPSEVSSGSGTVDGVADLIEAVDPEILVNLVLVTGVLAPVLEETVFRGFLLASLTKHMSVPAAVATSSLLFAAAHFSVRDFPQLFVLGTVMGFAYCRSRNLLTTIVIHGTWNSTVVMALVVLTGSGVPLKDILGR